MKAHSGQAMLVATLSIGGAILGATTVAGLLLLYQIRASTDSENSAKAIFAADTGVNWALYTYYHPPQEPLPTLSGSGATIFMICYDAIDEQLPYCDDIDNAADGVIATTSYAIAEGTSLNSRRAFDVQLANATATLP